MVADPEGIYYSVGEVDRELEAANELAKRPSANEVRLATKLLGMQEKIEKRDSLIRRMAKYVRTCEDLCSVATSMHCCGCGWDQAPHEPGCEWVQIMKELESYEATPERNLHVGFGLIEIQPFPEPLTCKTDMEGEWIDAAGTHDGGTVPEGDRPSPGPASARESEGDSE